jgi:hypothetical protein
MWCASSRPTAIVIPPKRSNREDACRERSGRCYTPAMTVKSAAFFALIGMILLTVLLALGFIRDISALTAGAIAAMALLTSLIHLLASLSVAVFLYVFYKAQS